MKFTCPCCGYRTLSGFPGSYEICKVCFWEDDAVQRLDPAYAGGANGPSLLDCQVNYVRWGASEQRFTSNVRPPRKTEERDPEWRLLEEADIKRARAPKDLSHEESDRVETWCYWKLM